MKFYAIRNKSTGRLQEVSVCGVEFEESNSYEASLSDSLNDVPWMSSLDNAGKVMKGVEWYNATMDTPQINVPFTIKDKEKYLKSHYEIVLVEVNVL